MEQGRKTSKKFGCQALFIDNTTWALINRRKGVQGERFGPRFQTPPLICPLCEEGELCLPDGILIRCDSCRRTIVTAVLRTLEQIATLPDTLGEHACECGHPEMRRLPDGVFHCPACGSEVIPLEASSAHIGPHSKEKAPWPTSQ